MTVPLPMMSPPASPASTPKDALSKRSSNSSGLSLDLSSLPPLVQPSPPSNTLIITNLNDPSLFRPATLDKIKSLVSAQNPLNSFAPIRSFCRIIISYLDADAAIQTRQMLDGASTKLFLPPNPAPSEFDGSGRQSPPEEQQPLIFDRIRCYFGEPSPLVGADYPDQHLKAPNPGKLFFISPPPSPPCGWEIREEDPPNKDTHADDLERALADLNPPSGNGGEDVRMGETRAGAEEQKHEASERQPQQPPSQEDDEDIEARKLGNRSRTRSMTVYHPKDHGSKEDLPAVIVSDTALDEDEDEETEDGLASGLRTSFTRTSRPPVELMEE